MQGGCVFLQSQCVAAMQSDAYSSDQCQSSAGEGGGWRFGMGGGGASPLQSVHPLIWDTHLCQLVFFFFVCLCISFSLRLFCLSLTPSLACVCSLFQLPVSRCVSYNTDLPLLLVVRVPLPRLLTNQIPPSKVPRT